MGASNPDKWNPDPEQSALERERRNLLQEALARPGAREAMKLCKQWQEHENRMIPCRMAVRAARKSWRFTNTDRTSPADRTAPE